MVDLGLASNDNERLALCIFQSMEDGTLLTAVDELCTDDFEWANSGLPTIRGKAELRRQSAAGGFAQHIPILETMRSFSADVLHIASAGDIVFTERVDHHWDADGRDLMTPHIAGVAEIRDGKIAALREFYDVACYRQEPAEPNPAHAVNGGGTPTNRVPEAQREPLERRVGVRHAHC